MEKFSGHKQPTFLCYISFPNFLKIYFDTFYTSIVNLTSLIYPLIDLMMVQQNRKAIVSTLFFNKSLLLLGLPCYQYLIISCQIHDTIYHHHHVVPLARISLTLSRHFSLSFIASGRSSGLHPVSPYSCCM